MRKSDYAEGCAAGRADAAVILQQTREGDTDDLPRLAFALREAAAKANSDDEGTCGHGIGFLFAVAAAACGTEIRST